MRPWLPTLVSREPVEAECRNNSMNRKEKTMVHVVVKSIKRVRSRTVTER